MLILKRIHESNPELHEIRNNGIVIGHVEIEWGYCRAYLGDQKFYEFYNHKFWNSFDVPARRSYHLDRIIKTVKPLIVSFDPKQPA